MLNGIARSLTGSNSEAYIARIEAYIASTLQGLKLKLELNSNDLQLGIEY